MAHNDQAHFDDDTPETEELREIEHLREDELIDLKALGESFSANDPVRIYLKEISKIALMTADEESELAIRLAEGNKEAKSRMTEANLGLVVSVARRYIERGVLFMDLIQEGNLGLIKAAEKFDKSMSCKFSAFAVWYIRKAIIDAVDEQARASRIPAHMAEAVNKVMRLSRRLRQVLGREPTPEELAGEMGISVEKIRDILKIALDAASLKITDD